MAAKVFNLSEYLEEKKSVIKLGEDEYEVSDGFNDLLKIDALTNQKDDMDNTEFVKEFLKIALGEEQAQKLIAKNYSTKIYIKIMHCIEEVYSDSSGSEDDKEGASNTGMSLV